MKGKLVDLKDGQEWEQRKIGGKGIGCFLCSWMSSCKALTVHNKGLTVTSS